MHYSLSLMARIIILAAAFVYALPATATDPKHGVEDTYFDAYPTSPILMELYKRESAVRLSR
jgi:hypothetical protein